MFLNELFLFILFSEEDERLSAALSLQPVLMVAAAVAVVVAVAAAVAVAVAVAV